MHLIKYLAVLALSFALIACQSNQVKGSDPNMPDNAFLDGKDSKVGVVLCHGRGKYPTWLVVDPLRKAINEQLGYHTLSIQMPTGDMNWREYESLFPQAYKRIAAAIDYLKNEKGVEKDYLIGHSMGSRMATAYLADNPKSDVAGFIGVGIRNGGGAPLDSDTNLRMVDIPVLDVYGDGGDGKDASHAETRSDMVGENYRQVLIPGADHRFTRNEKEMIESVVAWLQQQNGQSKNLLSASSTQ